MSKCMTTDHGRIIHWAGHRGFFPVRSKENPERVRLATTSGPDDERIGWDTFFEVFNHGGLALAYEDAPTSSEHALVAARPA